ncbi:fasciclin domain-containing protein [Dokdonia sp. Hel_I_53]|uniref:fasciclin domain-containing protein n=1 Tax=Dokdonia sp. Hel_I_53 TaxID=1566287 RepID=UPI00119C3CA7|nr:fasciclin domain-containing protein [Dokdonia sp. Hel_I_53]TVZ51768.1 putative surface protein with fasciclin (FAS1) repeats [Dokdonia sp. Hel_I_53]
MKHTMRFTKLLFIALTLFIAISCDGDDDNDNIIDGESNTIADFVVDNPNYSSLLTALQRTGLDATLAGSGTFTVFAPDNNAFDDYLNGTPLEDVDTDALTQLLLNHVLNQTLDATQLAADADGYLKTEATESSTNANISMYIDATSGIVINGQSTVTTENIETDNGIIHAVDSVIELPSIVTFATTNPNLTSLVAALTDEGNTTFTDLLDDTDSDFTVFAPTNTAFTTFLDGAMLSDVDNGILAQVLSNHVVPSTVAISTTLSNSYVNTTATFMDNEPLSLYINTDDGVLLNGTSQVVVADIVASNGVIHVVNSVIGLPDLVTFATADPNFSSLVTALTREDSFTYVTTLQTENGTAPAPFTVFAPTNDAFADLIEDLDGINELGDIPTATLASTLELHVLTEMNVRAEDLAGLDTEEVSTLNGASITIDGVTPAIVGPDTMASGFISTNIQASNGVIHAIDRVIRE